MSNHKLVLCIGNFDALHVGHIAMFDYATGLIDNAVDSWGVMFFEPHPVCFLHNKWNKFLVTPLADKLSRLQQLKVPHVSQVDFRHVYTLTAEEFFNAYLLTYPNLKAIVTGENFRFGANRHGDIKLLKQLTQAHNIDYHVIPLKFYQDNLYYSATAIRYALNNGDIVLANKLLGYNFTIQGYVIKGDQVARSLGFPTANLSIEQYAMLKYGSYAVRVYVSGQIYQGIANFGVRPSLDNTHNEIFEVHIFDFEADIYDVLLKAELLAFISEERVISSWDDLKLKIQDDIMLAKAFFEQHN